MGGAEDQAWVQIALQLINAGLGDFCCHLRATDGNQCKRRVPVLSLILCATGQEFVQLSDALRVKTKPRTLYVMVFDPLLKRPFSTSCVSLKNLLMNGF